MPISLGTNAPFVNRAMDGERLVLDQGEATRISRKISTKLVTGNLPGQVPRNRSNARSGFQAGPFRMDNGDSAIPLWMDDLVTIPPASLSKLSLTKLIDRAGTLG
jgi:hypothetical protein